MSRVEYNVYHAQGSRDSQRRRDWVHSIVLGLSPSMAGYAGTVRKVDEASKGGAELCLWGAVSVQYVLSCVRCWYHCWYHCWYNCWYHLESTCSTLPMSDQTLGRTRGDADKYCMTDPGTRPQ